MTVPDLVEIQRRVNESREQFLRALALYEKDGLDDGREITEKYLIRFLGAEPKRSPFAKDFTTEAINLIAAFGGVRRQMVEQVKGLNVASISETLGVTVAVLEDYIEKTIPPIDMSILDPTERLLEWSKRRKTAGEALRARQSAMVGQVADVGLRLDAVQRLAVSLLLARHSTLRTFRRENLELTFEELRRRITEQINEASKDEVLEALIDAFRILIEKSLKVVFEETIFGKVVMLLYKIIGAIRGRINTAPGAQDIMEKLLSVLRNQNEGLKDLKGQYDSAMAQLSELTKTRSTSAIS
jgi:hypothetical protein